MNTYGIIYIGSKAITIKLSECQSDGKINTLEYASFPLSIGKNTFNKKHISYKNLTQICTIINKFKKLIDDYKIETIKLVATTALREADNRDFIKDQIQLKTGYKLNILSDSEEKSYIYKGIDYVVHNNNLEEKNLLYTYIGTGRVSVALSKNHYIVDYLNLRFGTIKLSQILNDLKTKMKYFSEAIENYLASFENMLMQFINKYSINSIIMTGKEISIFQEVLAIDKDCKIFKVTTKSFYKIYDEFKTTDFTTLSTKYNLTINEIELLTASLAIYSLLIKISDVKYIYGVNFTLEDILLLENLKKETYKNLNSSFDSSILKIAYNIGKKYKFDKEHAINVTNLALKIYDQTQSIHGLDHRKRLLLQIAGLLHDIGKFVSLKRHYMHSYTMLLATNILGLSPRENAIIAYIARYHSYKELPIEKKFKLPENDWIIMTKLTSILKIADSLDRSHKQKIQHLQVKHTNEYLELIVDTYKNLEFEQWSLEKKSKLFKKIFGINTILKRKSD